MRLFGKNPVIERLRSSPQTVKGVFIEDGSKDMAPIQNKARQHGIPVRFMNTAQFMKSTRNIKSQGVFIDVTDFEYQDYRQMLEYVLDKKQVLVFLDNLTDPQNFGAILRTLGCLGNFCCVIPTHDSVSITESVLRVASGGENYVRVARVANLVNAIRKAKEEGIQVLGSVVKDGANVYELQFPYPLGIVIGSEEKGIRDIILKQLDGKITIPMKYHTMSYNVAHATTILAYEISKQKNKSTTAA